MCGRTFRELKFQVTGRKFRVNDSAVRIGIVQGEYHWHKHDEDDEFFFVLSGKLFIDLEGRTIEPGSDDKHYQICIQDISSFDLCITCQA
jgi:mannose-6-phosphate isomerase-like protein (cupin superfamily)